MAVPHPAPPPAEAIVSAGQVRSQFQSLAGPAEVGPDEPERSLGLCRKNNVP